MAAIGDDLVRLLLLLHVVKYSLKYTNFVELYIYRLLVNDSPHYNCQYYIYINYMPFTIMIIVILNVRIKFEFHFVYM